MVHGLLGLVHVAARQYPAAVEECAIAVQLAPRLWWLRWFYMTALLLNGNLDEAFREADVVYAEINQPLIVGGMAFVHGLVGDRVNAERFMAELRHIARTTSVPAVAFGLAFIGLGDGRAFEWLDKAVDAREPLVTHLPSMPMYDGLRGDPRFPALLRKMHLLGHT
jgi:serine/threonine-protein kinase